MDIKCPKCGKINLDALADGAVEGPRPYHAACWMAMTDDEQREAWDEWVVVNAISVRNEEERYWR